MNVTTARVEDLEDLLELMAAYQDQDENAPPPDDERNEAFLKRLISESGSPTTLFIGRTSSSGEAVGFVCIHCTPSMTDAAAIPRMTDLFVHPDYRLQGFGKQLFDYAVRWARGKGYPRFDWYVENMNMSAQYLFDTIENVAQTGWLSYSLPLDES